MSKKTFSRVNFLHALKQLVVRLDEQPFLWVVPLALLLWVVKLSHLQRPFWHDELDSALRTLNALDFSQLRENLRIPQQPILEYSLRKYFWYPLLGHQELALRIPSIFYSVLADLFVFIFALKFFKSSSRWGFFFAASFSCLFLLNTILLHYSVEARPYSLVSLASILWTTNFVFNHKTPGKIFFLTSLFYLNVHFFSLALIGPACIYLGFKYPSSRLKLTLVFLVFLVFTVSLNAPAFHELFFNSTGYKEFVIGSKNFITTFQNLNRFFSAFPLLFPVGWFFLFCFFYLKKTTEAAHEPLRRLGLLILVFPVFMFYVSLRSDRAYFVRYYIPFSGVFFCFVAALLKDVQLRMKNTYFLTACLIFIFAAVLKSAWGLAQHAPTLFIPQTQNFTKLHAFMNELKEKKQPVFVLANPCWTSSIFDYYFNNIEPRATSDLVSAWTPDTARCARSSANDDWVQTQMQNFLNHSHTGIVVIVQSYTGCSAKAHAADSQDIVSKQIGSSCYWVFENPQSVNAVTDVAAHVNFPTWVDSVLRDNPTK